MATLDEMRNRYNAASPKAEKSAAASGLDAIVIDGREYLHAASPDPDPLYTTAVNNAKHVLVNMITRRLEGSMRITDNMVRYEGADYDIGDEARSIVRDALGKRELTLEVASYLSLEVFAKCGHDHALYAIARISTDASERRRKRDVGIVLPLPSGEPAKPWDGAAKRSEPIEPVHELSKRGTTPDWVSKMTKSKMKPHGGMRYVISVGGDDAVLEFGKHQGKQLSRIVESEPDYLYWMTKQDFFPKDLIDVVKHVSEKHAESTRASRRETRAAWPKRR